MSPYRMKREGPIDLTWRPELAYAIGLIATDGCLYNDGRHINFTSKDLQLIETFMGCLGLKNHVGKKRGGFAGTWAHNLQFGSVALYAFLESLGITSAKSKTMGEIFVPKQYFPDFLRGLFDGDGSFYSYHDPRWRSSFMFYLTFGSASRKHIYWLQGILYKYYGVRGHGTRKMYGKTYQLKYAKAEAKKLFDAMYYHPNIPCLERKRKKVYGALTIDAKE